MLNLALHDPPLYLLNHLLLQPLLGREAFMFLLLGACRGSNTTNITEMFFSLSPEPTLIRVFTLDDGECFGLLGC